MRTSAAALRATAVESAAENRVGGGDTEKTPALRAAVKFVPFINHSAVCVRCARGCR
jgi:hypothetical protein